MTEDAKKSGWLGNLLILVVTTVITLLAVEYAFRLILGHAIVLFPRNHAAAQYGPYVLRTMTPNSVFWHQSIDGRWRFKTNNKGFRDDENYVHEKPEGTLRVLVLGDSHTAGFEVHQNEMFTEILEKSLRERGRKIEVLNAGVSGLGTAEHLAFLENEGLRYRPDVVVVAFFGNDYSDSARAGLYRLDGGKLTEASRHYAPAVDIIRMTNAVPGLKWLGENSYAYSYLFNAAWDFAKTLSIRRAATEKDTATAKDKTAAAPSQQAEYAVATGEATEYEEALVIALLKRIADVGRQNGMTTILVDVPGTADPNGIRASLSAKTREAGVSAFDHVLQSDQYLHDRPSDQLAHVPNGHRHISAYAHRRLGEALAGMLTAKGMAATAPK